MAKYESFHLRYDNGQRVLWGGVAGLAEHVEAFGSGLPTDAAWRGGGPLLAPGPEKDQHILAWVRGMPSNESGREGAWQAWGVAGPAGGFANWIAFWDALAAAPERERLDELAGRFARGGRGAMVPPVPQRLASVLADLYTADPGARRIVLNVPSELPLLAWCCLLGPVAPGEVTIGPPRRMRLNLSTPFSYDVSVADGSLLDPVRAETAASPLLVDAAGSAQRGDLESALETVRSLRDTPLAERRKRLFAPRGFAEVPLFQKETRDDQLLQDVKRPAPGDTGPAGLRGSAGTLRWTRVFTRSVMGLLILLVILLQLVNILMTQRLTGSVDSTAGTAAASIDTGATAHETAGTTTMQAGTMPPAATATTCDAWWQDSTSRAAVLTRVRTKVVTKGWLARVSGDADLLLNQHQWDANTGSTIAAALAVQIQIDDSKCASVGLTGLVGPQTRNAIKTCAASSHAIQQDEAAALQGLCTWSESQP